MTTGQKALLQKSMAMGGGGIENYQKLRDVIYGRPLIEDSFNFVNTMFTNEENQSIALGSGKFGVIN